MTMHRARLSALFTCFLAIQACAHSASVSSSADSTETTFLTEALKEAITATSYSSLIQYTHVEIRSRADRPSNHLGEETRIYHAKVLETFRGPALKNIVYSMIVEKGETDTLPDTPVIITLCKSGTGYYWPGVGAQFPRIPATLKVARDYSKGLAASSKPEC